MSKRKSTASMLAYLDSIFGNDSKGIIDELTAIVRGERTHTETRTSAYGVSEQHTTGATYGERIAAAKILLEYHQGKPEKTVNHNVRQETVKWDPDKLTIGELQDLGRLLEKADTKAMPAEVDASLIEGEFIAEEEDDKK